MMNKAAQFAASADAAEQQARAAPTPHLAREWQRLAEAYRRLAAQYDMLDRLFSRVDRPPHGRESSV